MIQVVLIAAALLAGAGIGIKLASSHYSNVIDGYSSKMKALETSKDTIDKDLKKCLSDKEKLSQSYRTLVRSLGKNEEKLKALRSRLSAMSKESKDSDVEEVLEKLRDRLGQ